MKTYGEREKIEALKEIAKKEEIIRLFQVEGLTQRKVAEALSIPLSKVQETCKGKLSKEQLTRKQMIEEVLHGKPVKEVAEKYNVKLKALNNLLEPYYEKEQVTKEQKNLILKYGVLLKVPVNYLAEYVPCSEKKCNDIIGEYLNENSKV